MQARRLTVLASLLLTSCGPDIHYAESPKLRLEPETEVFVERVSPGDSVTKYVDLRNIGTGKLVVSKITWKGSKAVTVSATADNMPFSVDVMRKTRLIVAYSPTEEIKSPRGTLCVLSNDPEQNLRCIDVEAQAQQPAIVVSPSAEEGLHFPYTVTGNHSEKIVEISNAGDADLVLSSVESALSADFVVEKKAYPILIKAGHKTPLRYKILYSPTTGSYHKGSLTFISNDPQYERYTLNVEANSETACIVLKPSLLDFGRPVAVGTSRSEYVHIESCSDVPLKVLDVIRGAETPSNFTAELEGNAVSGSTQSKVKVTYTPTFTGASQSGEFTVVSDDPNRPNAKFKVIAKPSDDSCPTARLRAKIAGSAQYAGDLDVAPLDFVDFDGSLSSDTESAIKSYRWEVKKRPVDSTSLLAENGVTSRLFIDLAGEYQVCLTVTDNSDTLSCNEACVNIVATPKDKLHVQLVWNTPKDTIKGDTDGADLDLHFVKVGPGRWGDTGKVENNDGTDIFWQNRSAVWMNVSGMPENPRLDRDDKDGEGPENVNLDNPQKCSIYALGVHYYDDKAFGESLATLRVFASGKLQFEIIREKLQKNGAFLYAALIFWDGKNAHFKKINERLTFERGADNVVDWADKKPEIPNDWLESLKKRSPECFP